MVNMDFVENFEGFDIYRCDDRYVLKRGDNFCGFYDLYSQALKAAILWKINFGCDSND